jgi:hypothetical protein
VVTEEMLIEEDIKEFGEEDVEKEEEENTVGVEDHCLFYLIVEKWAMCHNSRPNYAFFVDTSIVQTMS